jgi:hypothetical protein
MSETQETGTALAQKDTQRIAVDLDDPLSDLDQAFRLATMLAQSSMVPQALRGSPQNCLVTMLLGRELGLSWIQAIRGIYVLPNGQPGLRGALLLARIRAAGHRYEFIETDDSCEFVITRKDEEFKIKYNGTFTVEDAKAAGLVHVKDGKLIARSNSGAPLPWESYRRDMLQWRAVARGAARACPELIFGFDLAGIGDGGDGGSHQALSQPPAPPAGPNGSGGQDVKDKLAELDRQHSENFEPPEEPVEAVIVEDLPATEADPENPEARPPSLPELHELLRRCGFPGSAQTRVCSVLAHRDIVDMSKLTAGEIFMIHDTITRVAWGKSSMKERHDAIELYLTTAEGVEDEGHGNS